MAESYTDEDTSGVTIYWRIECFNCEPSNNFSIESQIFKIKSLDSNWSIVVSVRKSRFLSAFLLKKSNRVPSFLHYSLSVLTGTGWNMLIKNRRKFSAGGFGYGEDIVDLNRLRREEWFFLPNGSLTVSFRISNEHLINESQQRVMISRLIDGTYLRHQQIQTFSSLKPIDFNCFPPSYQFQDNATNENLQRAINEASLDKINYKEHINDVAKPTADVTKEVKVQQTQTDEDHTSDNSSSSAANILNFRRDVNNQHTQTDMNFKDLEDLRKLFKEKEFSFVTLQTPTREFYVHKAVLCAKSPVFNAMFERKMKENDSNVVDIDDVDNQTMALLVKFLQFEPLDDIKWEAALSLYYPADKYQIDSLKECCVTVLKKELSLENVCDVLCLADLHQDSNLMDYAQEYFCENSKTILPSPQWIRMLSNTELVAKLLCKLAATMR